MGNIPQVGLSVSSATTHVSHARKCLALLLAVLLAASPALASIQTTEVQLTNDPSADNDAAVSGSDIVFVSDRGGDTNIFWIDENGEEQRLNISRAAQEQPDVDAGRVVWTDTRFGGSDIFMLDLSLSAPVEQPVSARDLRRCGGVHSPSRQCG